VVDGVLASVGSDCLMKLAKAQPFEGFRLNAHGGGAESCHHHGGPGEKQVAGEDGDRVAPHLVSAGSTAPGGRVVHHIVVVKGREVRQFRDHRRIDHFGPVSVT